MKKWIAMLLVPTISLSMISCNSSSNSSNNSSSSGNNTSSTSKVSEITSEEESTAASGENPYLKKFDNVTYTTVFQTPAGDVLPDGQTVEDNLRTRLFTKQTGLVPKVIWSASGEAFKQKMNMMIASGEIPDYFEVGYSQYEELVKADLLADLTELYEKTLDPAIKEDFATADFADIKAVTKQGKIYGIPKITGLGDSSPILWVRKDWMEKLGLKEPETIADIAIMADAFMKKDPDGNGTADTYGIPILPYYDASDGGIGNTSDIFTNYGATPGQWRIQDGKAIYGSLTKETEQVLELLNSWYQQGLIPKDFGSWTEDMHKQGVTSGKSGLLFGPWWLSWSYMTDTVVNNKEAQWAAYALPKEKGKNYVGGTSNAAGFQIGVVSKKCKDPSMFIYALNDFYYATQQPGYQSDLEGVSSVSSQYTPMTLNPVRANSIMQTGLLATEYASGKITLDQVAEKSLPSESPYNQSIAKAAKVVADSKNPYDHMEEWSNSMGYTVGMMALYNSNTQFIRSEYSGITPTMEKRQTFLDKMEMEEFTKMIMGDTGGKSISDYFDDFVQRYLSQGGETITKEVQAQLDASK